MSEYSERLKDPRWQKLRLEVMQRDGFQCSECTRNDVHLNVHHKRYQRGHAPWEYPSDELVTLCEVCHEAVHRIKDESSLLIHQLKLRNYEGIIAALRRAAADQQVNSTVLSLLQAALDEAAEDRLADRIMLNLPDDLAGREVAAIRAAIRRARE
jgi:hypothetical protein